MKTKLEVVELLNNNEKMYLSEIARTLNQGTGFLSTVCKELCEANVIKKEHIGRYVFYSLVKT